MNLPKKKKKLLPETYKNQEIIILIKLFSFLMCLDMQKNNGENPTLFPPPET